MTDLDYDRNRYARHKLYAAVQCLLDEGPLRKGRRLTNAAQQLMHLTSPTDCTAPIAAKIDAILEELKPIEWPAQARDVTPRRAKQIALEIFDLFVEAQGGLSPLSK